MTAPPEQAEAVAFLRRLAGSEPLETHISLVFVGADTVWKLKKAVRLAFLDFTPLEARRRFTLRELELNRGAAPACTATWCRSCAAPMARSALAKPSEGPAIDWVLRMARVPAEDFLDAVAAAGGLTPELLDELGDAVAAFHCRLPPLTETDPVAAMRHVAEGNAQSAHDAGLPEEAVRAWQARILAALDGIAPWLARRARDGFVRRAHGDLHLGNLCLWQGRPVPFDALEFDEAMATIDLGYDLAFLLMDLDQRVARAAANRVLNRYVARTGDAALTRWTAAIPVAARDGARPCRGEARQRQRCHALPDGGGRLSPADAADSGGDRRIAGHRQVHSGTRPGTRTAAMRRARWCCAATKSASACMQWRLRSGCRNRPTATQPARRYSLSLPPLSARRRLGGHAVIADATFIDTGHRKLVETAAREAGVAFVGLWLEAPLPELEARIAGRQRDASDATVAVLRAASETHPDAADWSAIDAASPAVALSQARDRMRVRIPFIRGADSS